jgi:hypothetical protein
MQIKFCTKCNTVRPVEHKCMEHPIIYCPGDENSDEDVEYECVEALKKAVAEVNLMDDMQIITELKRRGMWDNVLIQLCGDIAEVD